MYVCMYVYVGVYVSQLGQNFMLPSYLEWLDMQRRNICSQSSFNASLVLFFSFFWGVGWGLFKNKNKNRTNCVFYVIF